MYLYYQQREWRKIGVRHIDRNLSDDSDLCEDRNESLFILTPLK